MIFEESPVISSSTVVNSVVEKLRAALARGQWRSGDMLPGQRELAEQLGISRPSLREAVIVLETLGLVRSMPGKGVVVLEASFADTANEGSAMAGASLEDVLQLRYTLEPFIVGLVAQSISSKEVGQLRLTLMDMREALEANDSDACANAYIAFHEELFALTSNPIFQNVVQQTSNALKQSADVLRNSPQHLAERLEENEAVVRAIRGKNSAQASTEMRRHILREGQRMGIELNIPDDNLGT
nr:FadR/GntR family transcriptional regulator [Pseudomonas fluorescens]